jgi:hypothetical protein
MESSRSYELLQELQTLRLLVARQVELLEAILETQRRVEAEIVRGLQ